MWLCLDMRPVEPQHQMRCPSPEKKPRVSREVLRHRGTALIKGLTPQPPPFFIDGQGGHGLSLQKASALCLTSSANTVALLLGSSGPAITFILLFLPIVWPFFEKRNTLFYLYFIGTFLICRKALSLENNSVYYARFDWILNIYICLARILLPWATAL